MQGFEINFRGGAFSPVVVRLLSRIQKQTVQNLKIQIYSIRKLRFQENICNVFDEDKKQHYCGDLVLGWAVLLFMKSSRIIVFVSVQTSYSLG